MEIINVNSTQLPKPTFTTKEKISVLPGQKTIKLSLKGKYLYNFSLECNPLINNYKQIDLVFNYIKSVTLKINNKKLSKIPINLTRNSFPLLTNYTYNLVFLPESPLISDTLYNSTVSIDLEYLDDTVIPKQTSYLTYNIGYHNNDKISNILKNKIIYQNLFYNDGTHYCYGVIKTCSGNLLN